MALTAMAVQKAKPAGKTYVLKDERGLYLEVPIKGSFRWRIRYWFQGRENRLSLGTYPEISLAEARKRRDEIRTQLAQGINPAEIRKKDKRSNAGSNNFENVAREWVTKKANVWSPSHTETVLQRLQLNIFPYIGKQDISTITAPELLNVLRRIEARGALEVGRRVRGMCSMIFRYAVSCGLAERDPAADLIGAIASPRKKHHPSITDPKAVGQLLRDMEQCQASHIVYCALRLAPLVFVRPGELRNAEWGEIDLMAAEWRIPAHKMKMRTQHIVPLSRQAVAILKDIQPLTSAGKYVFPSNRTGERPMSNNTINVALRRIGYTKEQMTGHGFRSMASTLLNELGWNRDAIERQLAHSERNGVRAAYNYAEYLPERRKMMQAWSNYLERLRADALA